MTQAAFSFWGFSGGAIAYITTDDGTGIEGAFTVGSGSGAEAPVVFENEAGWLGVAVGGNGDAGCGDNTNVSVDGTVLLSNDVARLGLAYRHSSGPARNPDMWVAHSWALGSRGMRPKCPGTRGRGWPEATIQSATA